MLGIGDSGLAPASGCFTAGEKILPYAVGYTNSYKSRSLVFDASRVVPTADENRPLNDAQPVAIYLGRRAQDMR